MTNIVRFGGKPPETPEEAEEELAFAELVQSIVRVIVEASADKAVALNVMTSAAATLIRMTSEDDAADAFHNLGQMHKSIEQSFQLIFAQPGKRSH